MSRNASGVYTLPSGSIVVNGENSDASDINAPLADLAADNNTPRPVSAGGTGGTTKETARTGLGITIGTDVQAQNANLAAISGLTLASNKGIIGTGAGAVATFTLSEAGLALIDDATAAAQRTTLGLGTAATTPTTAYATAAQGTKADGALPATRNPAWLTFDGNPSATIKRSSGVSSVTRASTGVYEVTLSTAIADTNYGVQATAGDASLNRLAAHYYIISTTVFRVYVINHGNGFPADADFVTASVLY